MSAMPMRLGAPKLDKGPHLNYALQWFAFALIFGGGGIVFAFRRTEAA
jgi:cytochrome oxidase assembly protein ShyY1